MTTAQSLRRVERAARHAAAARADFDDEIRNARANGATLREIATAAGIAVESVRKITQKKAHEMTSDEAIEMLFPKPIVDLLKTQAEANS